MLDLGNIWEYSPLSQLHWFNLRHFCELHGFCLFWLPPSYCFKMPCKATENRWNLWNIWKAVFYFTSRPALQYLLSWELRILHHYYYHCAVSNCSLQSHLPEACLAFIGRIYVANAAGLGGSTVGSATSSELVIAGVCCINSIIILTTQSTSYFPEWMCSQQPPKKPVGNLSSKETQHPCAGSAIIMQLEELKDISPPLPLFFASCMDVC